MTNEELLLDRVKIEDFYFEVYQDRPDFFFCEVNQIHSTFIVPREEILEETQADGIVSTNSEYPLAIKTADCLPIAFIGTKGIAMVHAGWRGLQGDIFNNKVLSSIKPRIIYIGPHIKKCCYQVEAGFHLHFDQGEYFSSTKDNNTYFDLTGLAIHQLKQHFPRAKIITSKTCTHCHEGYNSYRRDKTDKRNYNILYRRT